MKKKQEQSNEVTIGTADELTALIGTPVNCRFKLDSRIINVPVQRMSAATAEEVRKLRRQAQPPWNDARKDYDVMSQNYLATRDKNEKKARALIVYTHCPAVAAKKPGLTNQDEIFGFVQGLFAENVLEILSLTIQGGGLEVDLEERTNFISPPGSES